MGEKCCVEIAEMGEVGLGKWEGLSKENLKPYCWSLIRELGGVRSILDWFRWIWSVWAKAEGTERLVVIFHKHKLPRYYLGNDGKYT